LEADRERYSRRAEERRKKPEKAKKKAGAANKPRYDSESNLED